MRWEEVPNCASCGATTGSKYLSSFVPDWYAGRPLDLFRCDRCDLVRANPRPNADDLYVSYLGGSDKAKSIFQRKLDRPNVLKFHQRAIEKALGYATREVKSVFDVGCGAGTLMMAAAAMGLEAQGNDLNKASIEHLKSLGFVAHLGFTSQLEIEKKFDLVMCLDYLEHSYDPAQDLRFMNSILGSDGLLFLKTLYLGCPDHVQDGAGWGLFGNGHFHYFFPEVLEKMVADAGFEVAHVELSQLITIVARKRSDGHAAAAREKVEIDA